MAYRSKQEIGVYIDKLTNSIENTISGEVFETDIGLLQKRDLKTVTKTRGWLFNWRFEQKKIDREVYKLTTSKNSHVVQGLLSVEVMQDHIYMHLVENAPFNKGKKKLYAGVAGNLIAFACKLSFQRGYEGNLSFISKSKLVQHYVQTLGAFHFGGRLMIIETNAARNLVNKYFKN